MGIPPNENLIEKEIDTMDVAKDAVTTETF